jgi:hypothetical protein
MKFWLLHVRVYTLLRFYDSGATEHEWLLNMINAENI